MHTWGDEWFEKNGNDFYTAIDYCLTFWERCGRIGSHGKEKYGTFRHHVYFWDGGLHGLIWPGYVRIVNGLLYWYIDEYVVKPFTKFIGIHWLFLRWQGFIYNLALQRMCSRFPAITDELILDSDYPTLIRGRVDGVKIHDKYWNKL